MGLFNWITIARVANEARERSDDGFFITVGAVRRGAKVYFVMQTSKWDDRTIESTIDEVVSRETIKPRSYSLLNNGDYN